MKLENNEYEITDKSITISKAALERLRDYYLEFARTEPTKTLQMYQMGKVDILIDLIQYI